jgi:cytochrome c biogenesis protein CcdA
MMNEWINSMLSADQTGIFALAAVFLLGVVSVFTCACNFAVIGTVAGYTGTLGATGKTKTVIVCSLFFLVGTVGAMSVLGCVIGFAGEFISASMGNYWKIAAGVILILFGVYILDILPFKIPGMTHNFQSKKSGIAGAVLFGFVVGSLTSLGTLCCNPIFPIVAAASLVTGSTLWGFSLLLAYALGFGTILAAAMLGVGLGIGKLSKWLAKSAVIIKYVGGISLIGLGFYFIITV